MKKNYIKMNNNEKYLSLGNLFNAIKSVAKGNSAMQGELFCTLFNVKDINLTTINNYCIGIRAIGMEYKRIYMDLYNEYTSDKNVFIDTIINLLNILDECIYNNKSIDFINSNHSLKELCVKLFKISCNDENISVKFTNNIKNLIDKNLLYDCIIELLRYAILENKQPVYTQDINIKINKKELEDYLKVKLYEGFSYINSLISLSKKENIYACAELGSLEFDGLIDGSNNYDKSFEYYLIAANKNHPKACFMIANMILTKKVKYDFDMLWKYLNKSIELGSAAGLNTMGKCFLNGMNPGKIIDKEKAKYYFSLSSEQGYVYAFNNLGLICNEEEEAIKYFKISADMGESWALNKVGEYYRLKKDMDSAFFYYTKSNEAPLSERSKWASVNLKKYFNK